MSGRNRGVYAARRCGAVAAAARSSRLSAAAASPAQPALLSTPVSDWHILLGKAGGTLFRCLPVWLFLQSRDFINVHILYVGIVFLVVALAAAAIRGGGEMARASAIPSNNWTEASGELGPGWPTMFVIIACGAVSGFHSLCAGGTTCKQLRSEGLIVCGSSIGQVVSQTKQQLGAIGQRIYSKI